MKITSSELRDLSIVIALDEPDLFDLIFEAKFRSRDNGLRMQVNRLRALVDLKDGSVIVNAYGHLYNKDGSVGERSREQYLEADQIPVEVRHIIAEEARYVRELVGAVVGVRFA